MQHFHSHTTPFSLTRLISLSCVLCFWIKKKQWEMDLILDLWALCAVRAHCTYRWGKRGSRSISTNANVRCVTYVSLAYALRRDRQQRNKYLWNRLCAYGRSVTAHKFLAYSLTQTHVHIAQTDFQCETYMPVRLTAYRMQLMAAVFVY